MTPSDSEILTGFVTVRSDAVQVVLLARRAPSNGQRPTYSRTQASHRADPCTTVLATYKGWRAAPHNVVVGWSLASHPLDPIQTQPDNAVLTLNRTSATSNVDPSSHRVHSNMLYVRWVPDWCCLTGIGEYPTIHLRPYTTREKGSMPHSNSDANIDCCPRAANNLIPVDNREA